jgi:hypothetical protein
MVWTTTTEPPPIVVDGEFTVSNLNFTQDLLNETSGEFKQLADTFRDLLAMAFAQSQFADDIAYIEILGFKKGSMVVAFRIVMKPKPVVVTRAPEETGTTHATGAITDTPGSGTVQPVNGSTPAQPDPVTKASVTKPPFVIPVISEQSIIAVLNDYIVVTKPKITDASGATVEVDVVPSSIVVQIGRFLICL